MARKGPARGGSASAASRGGSRAAQPANVDIGDLLTRLDSMKTRQDEMEEELVRLRSVNEQQAAYNAKLVGEVKQSQLRHDVSDTTHTLLRTPSRGRFASLLSGFLSSLNRSCVKP
jgi:hypothetical protein